MQKVLDNILSVDQKQS